MGVALSGSAVGNLQNIGGVSIYTHTQAVAAEVWTIQNSAVGHTPVNAISFLGSGRRIIGIVDITTETTVITFNTPISGSAKVY